MLIEWTGSALDEAAISYASRRACRIAYARLARGWKVARAWHDRAVWVRAMVTRRSWNDRRCAMAAMRMHASNAAAHAARCRQVAAYLRRHRVRAFASAMQQWSTYIRQSASPQSLGLETVVAAGLIGRELARMWRRWRALLLVEQARLLRCMLAAGVAERSQKRRGLISIAATAAHPHNLSGTQGEASKSSVMLLSS